LQRYQLKERAAAPFLEGIRSYTLSEDKKNFCIKQRRPSVGAGYRGDGPPGKGRRRTINVAQLETLVDPRAEWAQSTVRLRIQREYFYDSKMHGNDWQAVYEKYRPFLNYVQHRSDLAY